MSCAGHDHPPPALADRWLSPVSKKPHKSPSGGGIDSNRLKAFSDGVMAVIITIMAFQLKTPVTASFHGLAGRLPSLLVYVLGFTVIGIYWNNHHHLLRATKRISAAVMWANLYLLFWLSLVPFATEWVGTTDDHVNPAVTYGAVAIGAAIAYFALVRSILRANRDDSEIADPSVETSRGSSPRSSTRSESASPFLSPYLAYACWAIVSLLWLVPSRQLAKTIETAASRNPGNTRIESSIGGSIGSRSTTRPASAPRGAYVG